MDQGVAIVFLVLFPAIALSLSCAERDSCNGQIIEHRGMNDSQQIRDRNCFCDRSCSFYDDCCEDLLNISIRRRKDLQAACIDYMYPLRAHSEIYIPTVMPVWMINSCLKNYQHTSLEKTCNGFDQNEFYAHPTLFIPMTNAKTNLTYRNIFCAECNNQRSTDLLPWSFQIVCDNLNKNVFYRYDSTLNIQELPPNDAERCTPRLTFPTSSSLIYPCKYQTVTSCPESIDKTIAERCSTINAYRYVVRTDPELIRRSTLYRNEFCVICHDVTNNSDYLETSCEHQLDDELIVDPKPKTGRHGLYRLSILFDPTALSIQPPNISFDQVRSSSFYKTHYTRTYPCRHFEVYDYSLHICLFLSNENDWRLSRIFNCQQYVVVHEEFLSLYNRSLRRENNDFVELFSDKRKRLICGERFNLIYVQHNRFLTWIRYISVMISLTSLIIFFVKFFQQSAQQNLQGRCLLMFVISLQAGQWMFLTSGHLIDDANRLWCIIVGIFVHFFYLCAFGWLTVIAFDTSINIIQMVRVDAHITRTRFILYNSLVWTFAAIDLLITIVLQLNFDKISPWSPNYGQILCSISSSRILILFFLLPIASSILFNMFLFLRTVWKIHQIDSETRHSRNEKDHERTRAIVYIRLALLMGLHWCLLIICILSKHDAFWFLFDLSHSLPTLFVAVMFKVRSEVQRRDISSQSMNMNFSTQRMTNSSSDGSPNIQMTRRLDDITVKLDKITRHLLNPNDCQL